MELKLIQRTADKNNTEIYKKAINFFVDELLSKSKKEKLKLKIIIKKFTGKSKNDFGETNQISKNRYTILINKNKTFPEIIKTLAHELVHVKQSMYGKLVMLTSGFRWNKKLYTSIDESNIDNYNTLEWETEALKLEQILSDKFFSLIFK